MKGHATIELRNVKTGEVTRLEEDNLVTNFVQEYFKDLGPTKGTPSNYSISDMIGGLLLFAETIPEDPDTVILPPGKTMVGNASIGTISNDAVTEMGSYVETESGWVDDLTYVQVYEFATNQANGRISSACLVPKIWGFYGEGNSSSNTYKTTKYDGDRDALNLGSAYSHNIRGYNKLIGFGDNEIITLDGRLLWGGDSTYSLRTAGTFTRFHSYFPFDRLDYRNGIQGRTIVTSQDNIDIPEAYRSEILAMHRHADTIIIDDDGAHFCICPTSRTDTYDRYSYLRSDARDLYVTHIDGTDISMDKIHIDDTIYNALRGTSSSVNILTICDNDKLLIFNNTLNPSFAYLITLSTGNYVRISIPGSSFMGRGPAWCYKNVWYFGYCKLDLTLNKAWPTNGGMARNGIRYNGSSSSSSYSDWYSNSGNICHRLPGKKLATIGFQGSSGSSYYPEGNAMYCNRIGKYLATINNLSTPIVKTSDMVMRITYRVTF